MLRGHGAHAALAGASRKYKSCCKARHTRSEQAITRCAHLVLAEELTWRAREKTFRANGLIKRFLEDKADKAGGAGRTASEASEVGNASDKADEAGRADEKVGAACEVERLKGLILQHQKTWATELPSDLEGGARAAEMLRAVGYAGDEE